MHTQALEGATSVITPTEVAAWLAIESDDPLISMLSVSATSAAIEYLGMELIARKRKLIHRDWPSVGTNTSPSLSRGNATFKREIELPYSHTETTIQAAKFYGNDEVLELLEGKPFAFFVDYAPSIDEPELAIYVEYTTGYPSMSDVPSQIKQAVLAMVAHMYEHRGSCDANDAMIKSGALEMLQPYKTDLVVF